MYTWDEAVDQVIRSRLSDPKNHDIYEKRLTEKPPRVKFKKVPHCIYFYYVRIDRNGKVRVDHYLYVERVDGKSVPIPHKDVPAIMKTLALNARPSTSPKNPTKIRGSHNFDSIPWQHWSYIAIFVDEANWSLLTRYDTKSAVVFNPKPTRNHSFFDGEDVVLAMPNRLAPGGRDFRSGVYFVNHMKGNDDGDDVGKKQEFKFDIWLNATFAVTSATGMRVNFDPGGTNQGPPTDPP